MGIVFRDKLDGIGSEQLTGGCDPDVQTFYEKQGMQRSTGMSIRHYSNQAGHIDNKQND
ncbi:hypothetical protein NKT34_17555 [Paenibacillus polysaccharolyticus]|uniref:hypothetical protein n=1 Tax=Paenibacillus TaxID=44249 RepID=UPI001649B6E0|nr:MULTISPECIES: hypothetical protein [Paenibacillus]MCM3131405.1 hypothetical protein [Paenibacillus polysaccharolyticus]MCP1135107.1 hypothetical protein [Paenibacillus polysaccharolyticus]